MASWLAMAHAPLRPALLVDAVRSPIGRRNGSLSHLHPVDLAASVTRSLLGRNGLAGDGAGVIDDVIVGCVSQVGEQGLNVARNVVLAAGLDESVPATTVDRQCGSSQQAVHFAAQGVMAGAYDVVVAAGVESMSRVPMGSTVVNGPGQPFGPAMVARYAPAGGLIPQGMSAERIARAWGLTREELDEFSLRSHRRAAAATDAGAFTDELVAVAGRGSATLREDEGIRRDTSAEALAALKPAFDPEGVVTAGNSSQISDGAAAVLVASPDAAERLGLVPMARFCGFAVAGADPVLGLTAPVPATQAVLDRCGLALGDIDLVEMSEAFAAVVLAWARDVGADETRVNVNGGAISLGHPLGCSGARQLTTLAHELRRRGGRYGLSVMCEGGGTANALVIEALTG